MILSDLKQYLMAHKAVSLSDIATHFDIEPDAMRGMLEQWIRKGKVRKANIQANCSVGCSTCISCDAAAMEIYEWTS
jgi:putative ferrous iron transport protein C